MLTSHSRRLSVITLVCAALAAAAVAPAASTAAERHASPTGSGTDCSSANPCGISRAVTNANSGDEVIVDTGDYSLTETLYNPAQITIRGVPGQARPRLAFSGSTQFGLWLSSDSTLRYVEVDQAAANEALWATTGKVDQVVLKGSAATGGVCTGRIDNSTIRNSLVIARAPNAIALCTQAYGVTSVGSYRNVTAVATGSGSVAIEARGANSGNATVNLVNTIAKGGPGGAGLAIDADNTAAEATISATHTNYENYITAGAKPLYVDGGGNQGTVPKFVDAAADDYRQAPGSVTIGAGLDQPINGAFDVDGDPREIGTTDIGADEFVPAPAATTGAADAVTDQAATLSGSVNPAGAPTDYHFEYGPTTAYGATTPTTGGGSGTGTSPVSAALGGLDPATTYHYRVVATNAGGVTGGADQSFTTSAATTSPSQTPPSTPPLAAPFAGVKLVSSRVSTSGRFVTLKLSCPAGTVDSCSGRTKLTTRRPRTASRPASTVILGRAAFSIGAGKQAKVRVRFSRAGRGLVARSPRLKGKDTNAARDGAGRSRTTVAAVTIRRLHR